MRCITCLESILLSSVEQSCGIDVRQKPYFCAIVKSEVATVSGFSKAKKRIDERMGALLGGTIDPKTGEIVGGKFRPWRTHDLRRTAVYQRHEYRDERRQALLEWNTHVSELVHPVTGHNGESTHS